MLAFCLLPLFGCTRKSAPSTTAAEVQVSIHFPEPAPVIPEDWPTKLVLHDKSGESTEHDAKTLYDACYIRGWKEYIYMYAGDFPNCLDIPIRCQTGYERIADWAGNAACKAEIQKLEREHGRKRLVDFLRKNVELF